MKKETIFTILLVALLLVSAMQTFQLMGLSGATTKSTVSSETPIQASGGSAQTQLPPASTGMVGGC